MPTRSLRSVLFTIALIGPATAHAAKVDICHVADGTVLALRVGAASVPAHLGHGDHVPTAAYADGDGDGWGAGAATAGCSVVGAPVDGDCDDTDSTVSPGATETCNGVDDDCDGVVDDGAPGERWYADADGDGDGDPAVSVTACEAPSGYVSNATDCDDSDPAVFFAAIESCDGVDEDCDGEIDETGAEGELTFFADGDGDGHGDAASPYDACEAPEGFVALDDDCDDADAAVSPSAVEACGGADEDCDGEIDESGAEGEIASYADADADGYGDPTTGATACEAPAGTVTDATDCDDARDDVNPGGTETCNAIDEDCDGVIDDDPSCSKYLGGSSEGGLTWYEAELSCEGMGQHLVVIDGADDEQAVLDMFGTAPGAFWVGAIDVGGDFAWVTGGAFPTSPAWASGEPTVDADVNCVAYRYGGSGWGDYDCESLVITDFLCEDDGVTALDPDGDGYTVADRDCDNQDPNTWLGAPEVCDGRDNDCDGAVDETFSHVAITFYLDQDGDGFGLTDVSLYVCEGEDPPAEFASQVVEIDGDCDDAATGVNPGATEACNAVDDDCDGDIDEGC